MARVFGAAGTARGSAFAVNNQTAGDQKRPEVATDPAGNFIIAWEGPGDTDDSGV